MLKNRKFTFPSRIYVRITKYEYKENLNIYQEIMSYKPLKVQLKLNIKHIKVVKIQQPKFSITPK